MITLYELHWSHYCEKIRLALNYMKLPWRAVSVDAFNKGAIRAQPLPQHLFTHTMPAIHDEGTNAFVMDSTPILRYLANTYPASPSLFPGDTANRTAIDTKLLEFDSLLGVPARRFAYTQLILECPELLSELFLHHRAQGFFCAPGIRRIAGAVIGMMLTKRFDFHRSESLGLYEALEKYLIDLTNQLNIRPYVVGEFLSAADLALAALLRPLTIVPFFAANPRLLSLFDRHRRLVIAWGCDADFSYQKAIAEARTRRPPMRRRLRTYEATLPFAQHAGIAHNDQKPIWTWGITATPFHYLFTLRRNKVRQAYANSEAR